MSLSLLRALGFALLLGACGRAEGTVASREAAERGRAALEGFGCGSCHVIPGVRGGRGMVGPPLTHFARRAYIAGRLSNRPDNLVRWIQDPQSVEPGTAMPDLDVFPQVAGDMAAYLYTLR